MSNIASLQVSKNNRKQQEQQKYTQSKYTNKTKNGM